MKYVFTFLFCCVCFFSFSQTPKKANYNPCVLKDSVEEKLLFVENNVRRIFVDTFDCREDLLNSVAEKYIQTKNAKYLDALSLIRQYPNIDVKDFYSDIIRKLIENDFAGFVNQLYLAKNKFLPLEKELIGTLNMIVDGRPYKQKYMGLLNVEISKAQDGKDAARQAYLEKLKTKIEEEKY